MKTSPLVLECGGKTSVFYDRFTIGRAGDYQVDDQGAPPHHAVLWPGQSGWLVSDLGTANGTSLNGERFWGPRPLRKGDRLTVGRTVLTVVPAGEPWRPVSLAAETGT